MGCHHKALALLTRMSMRWKRAMTAWRETIIVKKDTGEQTLLMDLDALKDGISVTYVQLVRHTLDAQFFNLLRNRENGAGQIWLRLSALRYGQITHLCERQAFATTHQTTDQRVTSTYDHD
jgi:hypothetical protein